MGRYARECDLLAQRARLFSLTCCTAVRDGALAAAPKLVKGDVIGAKKAVVGAVAPSSRTATVRPQIAIADGYSLFISSFSATPKLCSRANAQVETGFGGDGGIADVHD